MNLTIKRGKFKEDTLPLRWNFTSAFVLIPNYLLRNVNPHNQAISNIIYPIFALPTVNLNVLFNLLINNVLIIQLKFLSFSDKTY